MPSATIFFVISAAHSGDDPIEHCRRMPSRQSLRELLPRSVSQNISRSGLAVGWWTTRGACQRLGPEDLFPGLSFARDWNQMVNSGPPQIVSCSSLVVRGRHRAKKTTPETRSKPRVPIHVGTQLRDCHCGTQPRRGWTRRGDLGRQRGSGWTRFSRRASALNIVCSPWT
jgi:hypothetical protein